MLGELTNLLRSLAVLTLILTVKLIRKELEESTSVSIFL